MSIPSPLRSQPLTVSREWCNASGQMSNAHYGVIFDRCGDDGFKLVGLGPAYVQERGMSFYTAEAHICFFRPLRAEDVIIVTFQILDYDDKRIRTYQEMRHIDGWLAATSEILSLHVDLAGPRVVEYPSDIMRSIKAVAAAHAELPFPERAGKPIKADFDRYESKWESHGI